MGIGAREMDPFSAQKSGQKLQQRGISKFGLQPTEVNVASSAAPLRVDFRTKSYAK